MDYNFVYIDFDIPKLLADSSYPAGGTAFEWKNWINGFLHLDKNILLISFEGIDKSVKKNSKFKIIESYSLSKGIPKIRLLYYQIPKLYKAIKASEANFLFQQNAGILSGISSIICKYLQIPFVYRVGSDIDVLKDVYKKLGYIKYCFFQISLLNADYIICQNNFQYKKIRKRFPQKKTIKLYNPFVIDEKIYFDYKKPRSYVSWIGNFRAVKNLDLLLEIAKSLPNIKFKIAGKKLSKIHDEKLENTIDKLQSMRNISFVGHLSKKDIFKLLNSSILLLNTSIYEGFSNTYIESLHMGCPILCSKKSDPDNIIKNNNLGIVVDQNSDYVKSILSIKKNFNYKKFYKKSSKFVKLNFDYVNQTKKLIRFLTEDDIK